MTPFFFLAIIVAAVVNVVRPYDPVLLVHGTVYDSLWAGAIIGLFGMFLSLGLRHISHLSERKRDILILPAWVIFMTFIMLPIRIAGFFTMGRQEWMTR